MDNKILVESKPIERIYIYGSILLFFWFLFPLGYTSRHGPDPVLFFFFFADIGFIILGIALTVGAWKRKPIFWILLVATLVPASYIAIPMWAGSCMPSYAEIEDEIRTSGYDSYKRARSDIEIIRRYCF